MSFGYSVAIDAVMLVMCTMLIVSASLNEKIYDKAATFEKTGDAKLRKSGKLLGMNVEDANIFNNVVTILGSAGLGIYAMSLAMKKGKGSLGANSANKAPGVTTTILGFAVAVGLILSGVGASGLYDEIATFKVDEEKKAKGMKDGSYAFIALGAIVPILYIIKLIKDKKGSSGGGGFQRVAPFLTGGALPTNNAASVFFTY
jgi:hypothetical protein